MIDALKGMLCSKKAIAMVVGLVVSIVGSCVYAVPANELATILSPLLVYIAAQGVADIGK